MKRTADRKASNSTKKEIKTAFTVDKTVNMNIYKAYQNPQDQKKIFDLLEDIRRCKLLNTVKEDKVERYLRSMAYLLNGSEGRNGEGPVFNILGLSFAYGSAHGSRGGDWDSEMIKRLVNFSNNIKMIFEAIVSQTDL